MYTWSPMGVAPPPHSHIFDTWSEFRLEYMHISKLINVKRDRLDYSLTTGPSKNFLSHLKFLTVVPTWHMPYGNQFLLGSEFLLGPEHFS